MHPLKGNFVVKNYSTDKRVGIKQSAYFW